MAIFRFKFETLLRHRRNLEDQAQRDLAKFLRTRMIFQNQLRQMQQTLSQNKRDLSDGLVGQVDLARVGRFARYSGQVNQQAHTLLVRLAGLESEAQQARNRLLQASKARKAIEILRERHLGQWQRLQELREAAELDDLSNQRYARERMIEVRG